MIATIRYREREFQLDLTKPLDISIPLSPNGPRAWYVDPMHFSPVINQHFRGSVALAGSVNFHNVHFNPHGHGTHTESIGHITKELVNVNDLFKKHFFIARLITLEPIKVESEAAWKKPGDLIITKEKVINALGDERPEALVIRTSPNTIEKLSKNYSATNFPYFEEGALAWLCEIGVEHLLVDLPSVDREEDGGLLLAHRAFWNYPHAPRMNSSITEFVFVRDEIKDGEYILNLQTAAFVNDATPSRPVLYSIR
jgi:arylformamidase